ncbi:hypothetical protein FACS1894103_0690 [Campylobacterota bacterium]|nr:hypothetical protein FACS1894103_0420 [Campylobacterota bacterium]GHV58720.1 hypothetical protein FACS1894103_0690 [Campylobacterota bacterium]
MAGDMQLHLFGFEPSTARTLCEAAAKRINAPFEARAHIGGWCVIDSPSQALLDEIEAVFAPKAFAGNPFAWVQARLREQKQTISFAESCTGGLLAAHFCAISGASDVFDGSLITYANRIKTAWLGVRPETLKYYGAVSEECVKEMCQGTILRTGADFSLAISGIAGPSGGGHKPVGTVFVGLGEGDQMPFVEELHLKGGRTEVQKQAVFHALRLLIERFLQKK